MTRLLSCIVLAFLVSGCTAVQTSKPSGRVNHVVLCWLKEPGNETHRKAITEQSFRCGEIPGVLETRVGKAIPSDRDIVDDSFDVAISMTFASPADMALYLASPVHKKAVAEVMQPLVKKMVVYDFMEVEQ